MRDIKSLFLFVLCLFIGLSTFAGEELVFAVTLIRHGDRTPTHEIKADPHEWKIGIGELTALGMNQHNKLGTELRVRYVDKYKLLNPVYVNNSVYVRCTDFNRTIQSAESFLSGLYPLGVGPKLINGNPALPASYQPIPVRTLPVPQDKLLLAHDAYIDTFNKMCEKYVYPSNSWKDMESKYKGKFEEWSKIFGVKINSIMDLFSIGDNLNVRIRNGVEMPKGLSEKDAKKIIWLTDWIQGQQFKPAEVGDYFGSDFLVKLKKDMEDVKAEKQMYKYILYSGHDSSILPVMSALKVPLEMNPPYASHIDFEMYKDGDDYYVRVRFNNKDVELEGGNGGICKLDAFFKIVDKSAQGKVELQKK